MFLFASDDELRDAQRRSAIPPKGVTVQEFSLDQLRAERIDDDRELREHRRWRGFAFLLFIVPVIATVIAVAGSALAVWIGLHHGTSSTFPP